MAMSKKITRTKLAPTVREIGATTDYPALLAEVKTRIQSAQYAALKAVNKELVGLYWDIGRLIVERQKDANQTLTPALRALVAIELKIGEFAPEFVGKMQFYLAALDAQVRQEDENPSIGIILCKEKKRTIVEYARRDAKKPIGVATYEITRTLPKRLKDQLPSPEAIARLLENI
jgi:hypothetical protein